MSRPTAEQMAVLREEARARCGKCGAPPGEPCHAVRGRPRFLDRPHYRRPGSDKGETT